MPWRKGNLITIISTQFQPMNSDSGAAWHTVTVSQCLLMVQTTICKVPLGRGPFHKRFFHRKSNSMEMLFDFHQSLYWSDRYEIVRMVRQLCCRGRGNILYQYHTLRWSYTEINFPSNLNCVWKIVHETGSLTLFPAMKQLPVLLSLLTGPLVRYVKLRVVHAPGKLGRFSPPPRVSDPDMHHGMCVILTRAVMHAGIVNLWFPLKLVRKTLPTFPAHAQPAILRIW